LGFLFSACASPPEPDAAFVEDYQRLAEAFTQKEDYASAVKYYSRLHEIQPDRVDILYDLALAEMHLKLWPEALRHLDALIKKDPENMLLTENKAFVLASQGAYKEAYDLYKRIFDKGLQRSSVLINLSLLAEKLGFPQDSFRWAKESYNLGSKTTDDLLRLIKAGLVAKLDSDADYYIDLYRADKKADSPGLLTLGTVYMAAGRYEAAVKLAQELLSQDEPYIDAWLLRLEAEFASGQSEAFMKQELTDYKQADKSWLGKLRKLRAKVSEDAAKILDIFISEHTEKPQAENS